MFFHWLVYYRVVGVSVLIQVRDYRTPKMRLLVKLNGGPGHVNFWVFFSAEKPTGQ
jgi:hypothetical protein